MNIFEVHASIVEDYASYIKSFINISDSEISEEVKDSLEQGKLWPQPLLQFNPAYKMAGSIDEVTASGILHKDANQIFKGYSLYRHQYEAIKLGTSGSDFVVTSGTGSGKSLTYIGSIFDHLLAHPQSDGVVAVIVYPMNALINSQTNEFNTYKDNYERATNKAFPISFGQYTGQEKEERRVEMRENPPHILLTNYMMLELLLTRAQERQIRDAIYEKLSFLVFDELHTYRGRQGADVSMLIRRIQAQSKRRVCCIGTSATMVSVGSLASQREQVAQVASTMFGRPFTGDQVITETLARSLEYRNGLPSRSDLAAAISSGIDTAAEEKQLRSHPVAVWIENKIALEEREGQLVRGIPLGIDHVVLALAEDAGIAVDDCASCLQDMLLWVSAVNERIQKRGSRYTILPFKLHQFFAQTGSVYTTLDRGDDRFITLEPGIYKQDDSKKPIFPNVFSRATGDAFICVSRVGDQLVPREFRAAGDDDDNAADGYLIVGDNVWDPEEDMEYLPDAWVRTRKSGMRVPDSKKVARFPIKLFFDECGNCSETKPLKYWGWFMRAPLLFDPTGGVFFDTKTNEGTKLTKLGSEGRSTSTTITCFSILNRLYDAAFSIRDQKVLSFTDNRQDAALQSGHFNDFVRVVQLRAGIHKALVQAPDRTLDYVRLGEAVFSALALPFHEYANRDEESPLARVRKKYDGAFQDYLFYRALADLRRSWRIILPNLEQCALLCMDYEGLDETVAEDDFWADIPIVSEIPQEARREFIATILDFYRLEFAIHSENYLTPSRLKEQEKQFRELLKPPWTLDSNEKLREPCVIRLDTLHRAAKMVSKSMGSASSLGKYVKLVAKQTGVAPDVLRGDNYREFMLRLMRKLKDADYLFEETARGTGNQEVPVFRLRIESIVWKLGDGETIKPDFIKRRSYKDQNHEPNLFFRDLYRRDFTKRKRLIAADHTGQLNVDARREREDRFRADWYRDEAKKQIDEIRISSQSISALFCSPTMELGVDIGGLSVVHLRNAPPNAANYVQRSGRAGRSGQGALVFTYCSGFSPHDRHYFQNQAELVAGAVQAPRIDLCNRELLLTHINALAISEIGLPGLEAKSGEHPSLMRLITEGDPEMPLCPSVVDGLKIGPATFESLKATFRRAIADFASNLRDSTNAWYTDDWIDQNLGRLVDHLDEAMHRWRKIFRSARTLLTRATQPIESGRLKVGSEEYRKWKRLQDQANRQLNLLRNDQGGFSELSEFYPYRYLASEGFLPGYNFTRLPLRIFVPSGDTTGDFISRPRSVALREFGPLNLLYHNGRKYRVSQIVVQDADSSLTKAKVSTRAGYLLTGDQSDAEICPFSSVDLSDNANKEHIHDLLEMAESRGEEIERITCEEEERISRGFEVKSYFSIDGGHFERVRRAVARTGDTHLLNLRFMPAARLVHVNTQWRSQQTEGFPMGMTSGNWSSSLPEPDPKLREEYRLVKLWTSNVADALYIEPIQALGLDAKGVITLQHAIKRAIESVFQVEPNEIGVDAMGDPDSPNILLYEAAEGSLGILSQFVDDVAAFRKVVERAEEICRFENEEYLAPASYDDLLSYYNQRDHLRIDRFLIRDALNKLMLAEIEIQASSNFQDYESQFQHMLSHLDPNSSTERTFINYLYENGLRLPDAAQKRVPGVYCQPDFYYEPRIWIFCDGSPHDEAAVKEKDEQQRQLIISKGDEVWSWHYREDLAAKVARRPDIFRKVR
ncbi:MAG TPA: DEAD/DEAH box helicase [Phycisphaerae bacterium]|nr:DEAD/DEAH box helicase [Phycisphaerae bacterium]